MAIILGMKNIELLGVRTAQFLKIEKYLKSFISKHHLRLGLKSNHDLLAILLNNCISIPVVVFEDKKVYFDATTPIEVAFSPLLVELLARISKGSKCLNCSKCSCQSNVVGFLDNQVLPSHKTTFGINT